MLVTVTSTREPATELGYLLHKHPDRPQSFPVSVGTAHVFYPEASEQRCTAALMLEVDPVALVRGKGGRGDEGFVLAQYVNDRPYAASSMLAVAMAKVFRTAMSGRCDARPELATLAQEWSIRIPVLPCRGGPDLARRLFEPLGWRVRAQPIPLDETVPTWGDSRYVSLELAGRLRLAEALNHLYVLLPVLDDAKHYWVGADEVDKLVRAGDGWLGRHPERALIARRYLRRRSSLTRAALARLAEVDDLDPERLDDAVPAGDELQTDDEPQPRSELSPRDEATPGDDRVSGCPDVRGPGPVVAEPASSEDRPEQEARVPLVRRRREAVLAVLRAVGARTVADLGCGEGTLVAQLLADRSLTRVVAVDVSARALELAARRIGVDRLPEPVRGRLELFQSALTYRDDRLAGLDAAVLSEVVEHVDPWRLPAVEQVVFGCAAPGAVVVTTPNVEYNVRYEFLPHGELRHRDHRFEWTRVQFQSWAHRVAGRWGYEVTFHAVGDEDPELGAPTQLALFRRLTRPDVPSSVGGEVGVPVEGERPVLVEAGDVSSAGADA